MTLWRLTRNETAGAWRSLRYDLARRAGERGWRTAPEAPPGARAVDPTGDARTPRLVAAGALAILAVAGSAGSYLAVVNGVGTLLDEPTGPEPYPLMAEAAPQAVLPTPTLVAQPGEPAAVSRGRVTVVTVTVTPAATAGVTAGAATPRHPAGRPVTRAPGRPPAPTRPASTPRTTAPEPPCCPNPPVPTPTAPPSSAAPTGSPSIDPSPTAEPSDPPATTPGSGGPSTPGDTDHDGSHEPGGSSDDD